jgi:hypothetical protein
MKFDTSGLLLKQRNFIYSGYNLIGGQCANPTNDSGYIISGEVTITTPGLNYSDLLIIKTDSSFNAPAIVSINNISTNIPDKFLVLQNYPNPFNSTTIIRYEMPKAAFITLKIFDISGREIKTLINEYKQLGNHSVIFDGNKYSSGVYFYSFQIGGFKQTKKMVLLK